MSLVNECQPKCRQNGLERSNVVLMPRFRKVVCATFLNKNRLESYQISSFVIIVIIINHLDIFCNESFRNKLHYDAAICDCFSFYADLL